MLPVIAQAKEVQTVEELIQMYDSTSCKAWHQKIYEEWGKSLHARPLIGPVGRTLATFKGYSPEKQSLRSQKSLQRA